MHQKRLPVHPHPGDADVPVAPPAALHDVAPLRGKPGAHHIVDLAGHAVEPLGQIAALDLQHAVLRLVQAVLEEAGDQIGNSHGTPSLSVTFILTLTFFNLYSAVSIPWTAQKSRGYF